MRRWTAESAWSSHPTPAPTAVAVVQALLVEDATGGGSLTSGVFVQGTFPLLNGPKVELLRAYSNQTNVRRELRRLVDLPADRPDGEDIHQARQRQHRLRANEVQDLLDTYRGGGSVYVLAKAFTIDRRTVSAILQRHGIRPRYNLLDTQAVAEAARLYEAGWSLARLADRFGVTSRTVQNAFVKADIPEATSGDEPVDEPDVST